MKYFIFIISLLVIFIAAASISFKAGDIKQKCVPIIVLLLLEGAVAYALLHTSAGLAILHTASGGLNILSITLTRVSILYSGISLLKNP